jgi:hypothetical protein
LCQRSILVERDQHRSRLALLGDRHRTRAQRAIEQLSEFVLGFGGRILRRLDQLATAIVNTNGFGHELLLPVSKRAA